MKILCVFGQYQYGDQKRGLSTEYLSFMPAFQELGYEIIFFDSWDRTLYANFIELNQAFIALVEKETPDVIFSVQLGYEIWLETWDYIRATFACKTINWCTDDSWKYKQHSIFLANHFDLMVTTYEEFLPFYYKIGSNVALSGWAAPIQWINQPKKAIDCKYQVTFVGAAHGDRKTTIKKLEEFGIQVICFGFGWDNGAIDADEIPKIFNNSVISLNFANSSGENQIKARVFEVTGSGGFLLTENAKHLDTFFNKNEIAIFEDIKECAEKIKYYLNNYEKRDSIALNGSLKTTQNFTYLHRVKEIMDTTSALEKTPIDSVDYSSIIKNHRITIILIVLRNILLFIGKLIFKEEKGKRFARRAIYEFSWRFFRADTYKAKGIVGRMFYNE